MSWQAVEWAMNEAPMLKTPAGKCDTTARFVLVALAEVSRGAQPQAFPALATLRYKTGLDRRVIQRALGRLNDGGLITANGTRNEVTVWALNVSLKRPATDKQEIEREVEESRAQQRERQRKSRASRTLSTHTDELSRTQNPHEDPMSRTQNPVSRTLSPDVTHSEPPRTGKGTGNEPVPLERADADASPGAELALVEPLPVSKKRGSKDPAKDKTANELATRYYEAMKKAVKYMGVRQVVRHMLDNFTEDQVFAGLKHMATQQRQKPLTRQTLLAAIETLDGITPSAATRPSTTDQRVADAQALKARYASHGANVLKLPTGDER